MWGVVVFGRGFLGLVEFVGEIGWWVFSAEGDMLGLGLEE